MNINNTNNQPTNPIRGLLTEEEWREIVTLDYVLTWRYTDDYAGDLKRYQELSNKRWGTEKAN